MPRPLSHRQSSQRTPFGRDAKSLAEHRRLRQLFQEEALNVNRTWFANQGDVFNARFQNWRQLLGHLRLTDDQWADLTETLEDDEPFDIVPKDINLPKGWEDSGATWFNKHVGDASAQSHSSRWEPSTSPVGSLIGRTSSPQAPFRERPISIKSFQTNATDGSSVRQLTDPDSREIPGSRSVRPNVAATSSPVGRAATPSTHVTAANSPTPLRRSRTLNDASPQRPPDHGYQFWTPPGAKPHNSFTNRDTGGTNRPASPIYPSILRTGNGFQPISFATGGKGNLHPVAAAVRDPNEVHSRTVRITQATSPSNGPHDRPTQFPHPIQPSRSNSWAQNNPFFGSTPSRGSNKTEEVISPIMTSFPLLDSVEISELGVKWFNRDPYLPVLVSETEEVSRPTLMAAYDEVTFPEQITPENCNNQETPVRDWIGPYKDYMPVSLSTPFPAYVSPLLHQLELKDLLPPRNDLMRWHFPYRVMRLLEYHRKLFELEVCLTRDLYFLQFRVMEAVRAKRIHPSTIRMMISDLFEMRLQLFDEERKSLLYREVQEVSFGVDQASRFLALPSEDLFPADVDWKRRIDKTSPRRAHPEDMPDRPAFGKAALRITTNSFLRWYYGVDPTSSSGADTSGKPSTRAYVQRYDYTSAQAAEKVSLKRRKGTPKTQNRTRSTQLRPVFG